MVTNNLKPLDYLELSEKYKPENIGLKTKTLLVAEAPPPSGTSYFYLPGKLAKYENIEDARTLPHTIFYHHFTDIPLTIGKYEEYLKRLQKMEIFLMDILDEHLKIRDSSSSSGINQENYKKLLLQISKLRDKIKNRGIQIEDENIIFLDPYHVYSYHKELKKEFPESEIIRWIVYRLLHN